MTADTAYSLTCGTKVSLLLTENPLHISHFFILNILITAYRMQDTHLSYQPTIIHFASVLLLSLNCHLAGDP
ncbi:MAG: hypothetical protein V3S84_04415, partial [Dehalococcoidales bacterium]